PSGECIIGNFNDPSLFTWTQVGGSSTYRTTAAEVKAVFDARIRDAFGNPRPLVLASSVAEVQATPGTWHVDLSTFEIHVHRLDHSAPEANLLVCQSVGSWTFNIPVDGSLTMDGIKTLFPYNIWDGFRITPRSTSP